MRSANGSRITTLKLQRPSSQRAHHSPYKGPVQDFVPGQETYWPLYRNRNRKGIEIRLVIRGNYQPALYGNIFNASEFEVPESVADKPEGGTHRIDGPLRQDKFPGLQSPLRSFARNCHRVVQKPPTLEWPFAVNKLHMNSSNPVRAIATRAHGCKEGQVVLLAG